MSETGHQTAIEAARLEAQELLRSLDDGKPRSNHEVRGVIHRALMQ